MADPLQSRHPFEQPRRASAGFEQRAFTYAALFADFFHGLQLDLAFAPRLTKRRKTPLALQLWSDFEHSYAYLAAYGTTPALSVFQAITCNFQTVSKTKF